MATFSLVSMIGLLQIDKIVHGTLYSYGLEFSYLWAQPYWRMTALIFTMGWFNIISALVFQAYVVTFERKQARRFADAVRDEVMKTRIRAVEVIRETRQETKPTQAPKQKETTVPGPAPTPEADQGKAPEAEMVVQRDSPKESQGPAPTDQQAEPQPPQPEAQQNETKPETTEKKEETPIIIGIPAEELNASQ